MKGRQYLLNLSNVILDRYRVSLGYDAGRYSNGGKVSAITGAFTSVNCKCLENRGGGEEPFKLLPLTVDHYEYPWYISGAVSGASPCSNEPYTCFWRRRYKVSTYTDTRVFTHLRMHARTHARRTRWKKRKRGIGRKRHPYTCKLSTLEALEPVFNEQMAEEEGEPAGS